MINSKFIIVVLLSAILLLAGLSVTVIKNGLADIRFVSGAYYYEKALKMDNAQTKQSLLTKSIDIFEQAHVLNPNESDYHLQYAVSAIEYDQLQNEHNIPDDLSEKIDHHIIQGLIDTPTRSDLWSQLARNQSRHYGLNETTLLALDRAILYGSNERSTQMVNALITLYYWQQLDKERQQRGWLLILQAMEDRRLSKQINILATKLGWKNALAIALREKEN